MTAKASKPILPRAAEQAAEAPVDAFIARHRDELNASIRRSRQEIDKGVQSCRTIGDIISDGLKRHSAG